ncbi:MAG: hypothetical protein Q8R25_01490 [bacterium]|nr:hypothetical protein [bacterium]
MNVNAIEAEADLFMYASAIMSIPRELTQAVVVFTGPEEERVIHAIRRCEDEDIDFLFVAGINIERTKGGRPLTLDALLGSPYHLSPDAKFNVSTMVLSENTKTDAEWTANQVMKHRLNSLTITTKAYHLTRSYMTLLKSLQKVPWPVMLIPDPTPILLDGGGGVMETASRSAREGRKIIEYQGKNDVVSRDEFLNYMRWLDNKLRENYDE